MHTLRMLGGVLVGYIVSAATSIGWFNATHHQFADEVSPGFLLATALFGILASLLAGYVAALVGASRSSAIGVAIVLAALSIWSIVEAHTAAARTEHIGGSLAATWIALFLMAPAAAAGGWLWRRQVLPASIPDRS